VKKFLALLLLAGFLGVAITTVSGCEDKKTSSSASKK
jgi:hypothetical protein